MIHRNILSSLLFLLVCLPARADEPGRAIPPEIRWKVQPEELVTFSVTVKPKVHHPNWSKNNKSMIDKLEFRRFGYQLLPPKKPDKTIPFPEGGWGLADVLVTRMPPPNTPAGGTWKHAHVIDHIFKFAPVAIQGNFTLVGWVKHEGNDVLLVKGTFQVDVPKKVGRKKKPKADPKTVTWVLTEPGTIHTQQWIDPQSGRVVQAKAKLKILFQHHQVGARLPRKFFNQIDYRYKSQKHISGGDLDGFVDYAVTQGVKWLRARQKPDGSFEGSPTYIKDYAMGVNALCLLTLLKSGVPADDPAIKKGFAYLHTLPLKKTYSVGVYLMAIEALHVSPQDKKKEALRPGQAPRRSPALRKIPPGDRARMVRAVRWLLDGRREGSNWSYPSDSPTHHDHSNTQYAILGLKAASRCGFKIPTKLWKEVIQYFAKTQESDGPPVYLMRSRPRSKSGSTSPSTSLIPALARGWSYCPGQPVAYASMTTAGLTSLIISRSELVRRKSYSGSFSRKCEKAIHDGLAWHQHHYDVNTNPGRLHWVHHYYLYGLERVGMLARMEQFGERPWYDDGARFLCTTQERSGRWFNTRDTCFALLFLKRATTPVAISGE